MRKLLNTLFVTSEDAYLALENENVVIYKGEEKAAQYPLKLFESLLSFSYKGASPALMGACVRNGIGLTFLTPSGRMLARVVGESQGNVRLRKEQYRVSDNPEASCRAARNFIFGKVHNSRWVLERTLRDHALRVKAAELRAASAHLQEQLKPLLAAETLAAEGVSARVVDMFTVKPIDAACVRKCAAETGAIVTCENESVIGGLGSAVAEVVCETKPVPVVRVGVRDTFGKSGPAKELLHVFGLDAAHIAESARQAIAMKA